MKVLGALESAQLEWFLDAGKPTASSYVYRVIYVSDLKQVQVSDGTNWVPFLNTSTNQTLSGDITFAGQQIFNGLHRLSVTTNSATGPITALAPTTPVTEFTGAVTSVSGITSGASGATVMLINRSGSPFTINDESTGAVATNRIRTGTGASITLTNNASILLTYAGDSRWHIVGGTGSSSAGGSKNYFSISSANPNFSQNSVSPWSACTLTLSSGIPSGAPTLSATQMAIATTGTNPLLGSQSLYNLQLTKSAANAQGQGFISGALTIDREDLAKVLTGSFSYEVVSGTVDLSGQSTQSLEIWIYNTVTGAWTQPAGYRGMNQSSGSGVVTFTFQTDSGAANNSYRIAVITAQTSTSAYVVNFNDFSIGPQTAPIGPIVTDWVSFTPTGSWTANTTYAGQWRRVGDSAEYQYILTLSGAPTAANLTLNLFYGHSIDTNKLSSTTRKLPSASGSVGDASPVNNYPASAFYNSATSVLVTIDNASSTYSVLNVVTNAVPITFAASDTITVTFSVPIQGWSSNVQISSDTDTRVISFTGSQTSQSVTANVTDIAFTASIDRAGAWTGSQFVVPVSGDYLISIGVITSASTSLRAYLNGSVYLNGYIGTSAAAGSSALGGSILITGCTAGQTLSVRSTGSVTITQGTIGIYRLSGPSVVAATETVTASYSISANFAASTTVPINFDVKDFDSHNAVTPSATAWKFSCPVSGTYLVSIVSGTTTANVAVQINKNGSASKFLGQTPGIGVYDTNATLIKLNAGDYIDIRPQSSATFYGGSLSSGTNIFSIVRVGN